MSEQQQADTQNQHPSQDSVQESTDLQGNVDPQEIAKFDAMAMRWWDTEGEFKPLHDINPARLSYVQQQSGSLEGKKVIDVGCGGGILAESMALAGADVTGIDMGKTPLMVAKMHLYESGATVNYQQATAEEMAEKQAGEFDVVTCMEMLEHVPDPASIIRACYKMVKPGGHVFFSTINRNPKAYALAIVGAEYLMRLVPKGTHDYKKFIKPSELTNWIRHTGLTPKGMTGMSYNPLTRQCTLNDDIDVNYIIHTQKLDD